jgi:quercetin dioxygenase-like cupin family protein
VRNAIARETDGQVTKKSEKKIYDPTASEQLELGALIKSRVVTVAWINVRFDAPSGLTSNTSGGPLPAGMSNKRLLLQVEWTIKQVVREVGRRCTMYRTWIWIGSAAVVGVTIGFGLGSALAEQPPQKVDLQVLGVVDAGENCPGHVLRMRRVTFAPGASIPMHSHKDRPEVALVVEGTLTNTLKGQSPTQLAAGTAILNGPEVEHLSANETSKPVVVLGVDVIKK